MKALLWILTIAWLGVAIAGMGYVGSETLLDMSLNEWGDFLAGVFAPLAFLWFVFGYFRHGDEIVLQQQEIRNQVAETARLAKHSETQAEATETLATLAKAAQVREELARARAEQPQLSVSLVNRDWSRYTVSIKNEGCTITGITCSCERTRLIEFSTESLDAGEWGHLVLEFNFNVEATQHPFLFMLRGVSAQGYVHEIEFRMKDATPPEAEVAHHRIFQPISVRGVGGVDEVVEQVQLLELTAPIKYQPR